MTAADCWADLEAKAISQAVVPLSVEDDHLPLEMALTLLADAEDMAVYSGAGSANVAYVARQCLKLIEAARHSTPMEAELLDALKAMRRAFGDPMTRRALGGHNERQMEAILAASAAITNAEEAAK